MSRGRDDGRTGRRLCLGVDARYNEQQQRRGEAGASEVGEWAKHGAILVGAEMSRRLAGSLLRGCTD
jgi:hypothetical protein